MLNIHQHISIHHYYIPNPPPWSKQNYVHLLMHLRGQVRKVHAYRAYRGQALLSTYACRAYSIVAAFQEPRSRFPGACGGRGLSDLACLQTAGLYERPSSARVTERVRLPLVIGRAWISPCTDRGQASSSARLPSSRAQP